MALKFASGVIETVGCHLRRSAELLPAAFIIQENLIILTANFTEKVVLANRKEKGSG